MYDEKNIKKHYYKIFIIIIIIITNSFKVVANKLLMSVSFIPIVL